MKNNVDVHTNAYSIIGKKGLVISDIDPISGKGQVKVDNEVWSAKTNGSNVIPKDTLITVTAIEGVKAIVSAEEKADRRQHRGPFNGRQSAAVCKKY